MSDAESKIGRCLKYLQNNPTERNLLSEEAIYRNVLEQNQKADSVHQINMEKYPSGALNRFASYRKALNEKDMATQNKLMRKFLVEFPKKPADERFNDDNVISYDNIYFSLLFSEVFKKNYNALYEYLPKLSLGGLVNVYYKIITIPHNRKALSDDFLYPYADSLVKQILKEKNDKPFQYRFLSPKEWNRKFEKMLTQEVLLTHVSLLRNSGHISEALSYAERAQKVLNYTVAGLNEDLCYLLEQEGKQGELDSVLRKSMYHNQVTPYLIDLLKKNYVAKKGSAAGFDAYMRSLKKTESAGEISERILKDKRRGKMPAWELVDANGKKISSKDLLGKTYVLDFWASWCVPCKASFPGMKLAVERYRNKSDVALFFVNTEEYLPTYKEAAKKFITEKNYPFHILFDNKVAGAKVNDELFSKVCKEFKISGIPQKVFVDKKGNVQFISVGYKGSPSELADDISELIEATKKAAAK
ncbi:TlpA family protein disulfide reductase [Prolixibacter bellariivorans]|nr:TlpA disulfide reductase family protein [Prolixibacter bellariivorans]